VISRTHKLKFIMHNVTMSSHKDKVDFI